MDAEETVGGRPVFGESPSPRLTPRVARIRDETWPELGNPKSQPEDDGGAAHIFEGRAGVEVRLGSQQNGEVRLGIPFFCAYGVLCLKNIQPNKEQLSCNRDYGGLSQWHFC
jgi:hypothetical protein